MRSSRSSDTETNPSGRIAPCLAYLIVEFGRPMAWVSALALLKPGMIVSIWGFGAALLVGRRPIPRPLWYMFGLLALMAWNVPWAVNNAWALQGFWLFAIIALGGALPLAVLPPDLRSVRKLMTVYSFVHVPLALYALLNQGRGIGGWMGDENDLALTLNVAIGVSLYLLFEASSRAKKIAFGIAIGVMLCAIVSSFSRGGFVGMASLALFLLLVGPNRGRVLSWIVLGAVVIVLFAPPGYWNEIRSITKAHEKGETGDARFYFWGIGWRMFLDHPITGVGTKNYGIRAPEYESVERQETLGWHMWGRVAHSLYFTLLPEQGLVGTALFVGLLVWCYRARRKLRRISQREPEDPSAASALFMATGLWAGIFAVLATGVFLSVLYYPMLWVMAGMMGALDRTFEDIRTRSPSALSAATVH